MQKRFVKWLTAFGIFLVFMWVCTIISRSRYVSELTFVKTEQPSAKYIEHIVEVDGIVTGGSEIAVNVLLGLRVDKIYVSLGDSVKVGDVLFKVDLDDLQDIISEKESELAKLKLQLADTDYNNALASQEKEISILWAQEDYENADSDTQVAVDRAFEDYKKAYEELQEHLASKVPVTSDEARKADWDNYNNWKQSCYDLEDRISDKQSDITKLESSLSQIDATDSDEYNNLQNEINEANDNLAGLQKELKNLERNPVQEPDYTKEENEYDAWQSKKATFEDTLQSAKRALDDANRTRQTTLQQKLRDVATAQVSDAANSSSQIYAIQISDLQNDIALLDNVKNNNGEIKASSDGYISNISVSVGSRTTDTPAIVLTDTSSECKFNFSITKEQAKYIRLNDTLDLTLNGQSSVKVTADYYTQNSQGGYDITCKLDNTQVPLGTSGTITRTVQGDLHQLTLPIDAIHEENNVTYVYTLNEKSGILGSEYYVEKIKVQVSDKNNNYAAIESGVINSDTNVIIYSSKELEQGETVRLDS